MKKQPRVFRSTLCLILLVLNGLVFPSGGFAEGLSGIVTDESSQPLAGVGIDLSKWDSQNGYFDWFQSERTDENGLYSFTDLETGTYSLRFWISDGSYVSENWNNIQPPSWERDGINFTTGENITGLNAQLSLASRINGTLINSEGLPASGVPAQAYTYNGSFWVQVGTAYTDPQGNYSLGGLLPGTYRVVFASFGGKNFIQETWDNSAGGADNGGTTITLAEGEIRENINAVLEEGASISGVVVDAAGQPIVDVGVVVYQWNGSWWQQGRNAWTNAAGEYTLAGLAPGTYRVGVGIWQNLYVPEYIEGIVLGAAEIRTGVHASLELGGTLQGVVMDENSNPLSGIWVKLNNTNSASSWWDKSTTTDAAGAYAFQGLASGTYRVGFGSTDDPYLQEVWDNVLGSEPDMGQTISVVAGAVTEGIDAMLAIGGSIQGQVIDGSGQPIPDLYVDAYSWNGSYWAWAGSAPTDENGDYEIQGLGTGTYRVLYSTWNTDFAEAVYGASDSQLNSGSDVSVTQGSSTSGINTTLQRWGTIAGQVTETANGLPMQGIQIWRVSFDSVEGGSELNVTQTDDQGRYEFTQIRPGQEYYVFVQAPADENLLSEWFPNVWDFKTLWQSDRYATGAPPSGTGHLIGDGTQITNVDFSLDPGGIISGTMHSSALPLVNAQIEVWPEDAVIRTSVFSERTDVEGAYTVHSLVPGSYHVYADADFLASEWHAGQSDRDTATMLTVTSGATHNLDFDLTPGQAPTFAHIQSDPQGAEIYLNYQPTGQVTPAIVALGDVRNTDELGNRYASHVVTLVHASYPQYEPIGLRGWEGQTEEVLVDLVRATADTGSIQVLSDPSGATVYVDVADTPVGVTPIVVENLAAGSQVHTVFIKKEGYLQPRPAKVWVSSDETSVLEVVLTPDTEPDLALNVSTTPAGEEVYANYLPTGQLSNTIVSGLDPAGIEEARWLPHTVWTRKTGEPPRAPMIVDESWEARGGALQAVTASLADAVQLEWYSSDPLEASGGGGRYWWTAPGSVTAWGANDQGQSDNGITGNTFIQVAAGSSHSLALRFDGTLFAWGDNTYGQGAVPGSLPVIRSISAGGSHNLAVSETGTVHAWGLSTQGQTSVPPGLAGVVEVGAGVTHSLALKADGSVVAWGSNLHGESTVPVGLEKVVAIAAGDGSSYALKSNGQVVAWGRNDMGQTTLPTALSRIRYIAAGAKHALAIDDYGRVWGWGDNTAGQARVPKDLPRIRRVAAGDTHTLVLAEDGRLFAWGDNTEGQLNVPSLHSEAAVGFVASGGDHNLLLTQDSPGLAGTWLSDGQIQGHPNQVGSQSIRVLLSDANGRQETVEIPISVTSNPNQQPVLVSSLPVSGALTTLIGETYSFSVTASDPEGASLNYRWTLDGVELPETGNSLEFTPTASDIGSQDLTVTVSDDLWDNIPLVTWPLQTPDNTRPLIQTASPASGTATVTRGEEQIFSVTASDSDSDPLSYVWSINGVVTGTTTSEFSFVPDDQLPETTTISVTVSDGIFTTQVVQEWTVTLEQPVFKITTQSLPDGMEMVPYDVELQASGGIEPYRWRIPGKVIAWGQNSQSQSTVPSGLTDVISIAAGTYQSLALKTDGTVLSWGMNIPGQSSVPIGLTGVIAISGGVNHSLALKSDGTVVAWGYNYHGQSTIPTELEDVVAIASGFHHNLALKSDGTVVAWGYNGDGQCTVPNGLMNVVAIAAGDYHSLAIRSDGSVVGWGANQYGQSTPPSGLTNVLAIAGGSYHSLALKSDGSLVAWGGNWDNQSTIPNGLSDITSIACGGGHNLVVKTDGTVVSWGANDDGQTIIPEELTNVVAISAGGSHSLVIQAEGVPEGMSFTPKGLFSGTPVEAVNSELDVFVRDIGGGGDSKTLSLNIAPNPNTRPEITDSNLAPGGQTLHENASQTFSITANDPEGQPLTYIWKLNGEAVGFNQNTFDFSTVWGEAGSYTLEVEVQDDLWNIGTITRSWDITVPWDNDGDKVGNLEELDLGRDPNDPIDGGALSALSGMIIGDGTPLEGSRIELRGASGKVYAQTVSAVNGSYILSGVIPGTYQRKVIAEGFADQWYDGVHHQDLAQDYVVPSGSAIGNQDVALIGGQSPAYVRVQSDPAGAEVFFNYYPTGEVTPVTLDLGEIEGAQVASHVITLLRAGSPRPVPQTVPAVEAETVEIMFDLVDPASGSISIDSSPQGATVYVDRADVQAGFTPVTVNNLAPGSHVVLLKHAGSLQPRPVIAWVEEGVTTIVNLPLTPDSSAGLHVTASSSPSGMDVFVDYLPTGQVTDVVISTLDAASHSGSGWHSASHTILLSHPEWGSGAARYVDDENPTVHQNVSFEEAVDEDGNGLPDQWEEAYDFANQAPAEKQGAADDADGDGVSNEDELAAGTNPLSASSKVAVTSMDVQKEGQNDRLTMTFQTVPGRKYVVQTTSVLGAAWVNISGVVQAQSTTTTFVITLPANTDPKFYRLLILR